MRRRMSSGPIRVAQFLNSTVRSGAEEVALELARGLDPARFRSYLVCPAELLEAFGSDIPADRVHAVALPLHSPFQLDPAKKLIQLFQQEKIEVLHAHMIRAAAASVPLARFAGVPAIVQTCHGREAWRKSWWKRTYVIDRMIARMCDETIAVSEATKRYLIEEKRIPAHRIVVVRNGRGKGNFVQDPVHTQSLRREFGIGDSDTVVSVFGRLEEQKGHRYFVAALPAILAQYPSLKGCFVGEGVLREELTHLANLHNVANAIAFTGYRKDWAHLMDMSDIVVLPSLYEGMPLVAIEAAAFSKPMVATAVDGTTEVIVDRETGLMVPPRDAEGLASAVIELLSSECLRSALGTAAHRRADQMFSIETQIKTTEALYCRMLSSYASYGAKA